MRGEARRGLRVVLTILLGIGKRSLEIIAIQLRPGWAGDGLIRVRGVRSCNSL